MATEQMLDDHPNGNYGEFKNQAALSQALRNGVMQHYFQVHSPEPKPMPAYMAEAISMICHKLACIANGNPHYVGSWDSIENYAALVSQELQEVARADAPPPRQAPPEPEPNTPG